MKAKDKPAEPLCPTCGRPARKQECSHVDCALRRRITAGPPDDMTEGGRVAPHLWEER